MVCTCWILKEETRMNPLVSFEYIWRELWQLFKNVKTIYDISIHVAFYNLTKCILVCSSESFLNSRCWIWLYNIFVWYEEVFLHGNKYTPLFLKAFGMDYKSAYMLLEINLNLIKDGSGKMESNQIPYSC